jgi:hypothetical protein
MKHKIIFISILTLCFSIAKAQTNLFTHLDITPAQLSQQELANYEKLTTSTLIKSIHFVSLNDLESV